MLPLAEEIEEGCADFSAGHGKYSRVPRLHAESSEAVPYGILTTEDAGCIYFDGELNRDRPRWLAGLFGGLRLKLWMGRSHTEVARRADFGLYLERLARRLSSEGFAIASVEVDYRKPAPPSKRAAQRTTAEKSTPRGPTGSHSSGLREH